MNSANNTPNVLQSKNMSCLENMQNLQNISNMDYSFDNNNLSSENIQMKNEIKIIESSFSLHSLPSFSDLLSYLFTNNNLGLLRLCLNNMYKILQIKAEDNQRKVEFLEKIQKLENEKQSLEKEVSRFKNTNNDFIEKLKRMSQQYEEKKKESEEEIKKYKAEVNDKQTEINRWRTRYSQLQHELAKLNCIYERQNETISKRLPSVEKSSSSKELKFLSANAGKSDISLSYVLDKSNSYGNYSSNLSNLGNLGNITTQNCKLEFLREFQKNVDDKLASIMKENEALKNFLVEFNLKFIQLVNIKKNSFLDCYRKTFGSAFPNEDNLPLDPETNETGNKLNFNTNLNLSLDIDSFIKIFHNNFIRLEEFLAKNEELEFYNNIYDECGNIQNNTNNSNNLNLSKSVNKIYSHSPKDKDTFLTEKYVNNMITIFKKYKGINCSLSSLLDVSLRWSQIRTENSEAEVIQMVSKESLYLQNIRDLVKENDVLLQTYSDKIYNDLSIKNENSGNLKADLNRTKEAERVNIENFRKFNYNLSEEIQNYEKIVDSVLYYCRK